MFAAFFVPWICLVPFTFLLTQTVEPASVGPILAIVMIFGFFIIAAHVVVIGIPTYFIVVPRHPVHLWSAALTGALIGVLPFMIFVLPIQVAQTIYTSNNWNFYFWTCITFSGFGALGGLSFWATWTWLAKRAQGK